MNRDQLIGKDPEQSGGSAGTQPGISAGTTRRRLLRQAATVAPVIMTLRSGSALAVGSACIDRLAVKTIQPSQPPYLDDYVCIGGTFTEVTPATSPPTYTCAGTIVTASSESSSNLEDKYCDE